RASNSARRNGACKYSRKDGGRKRGIRIRQPVSIERQLQQDTFYSVNHMGKGSRSLGQASPAPDRSPRRAASRPGVNRMLLRLCRGGLAALALCCMLRAAAMADEPAPDPSRYVKPIDWRAFPSINKPDQAYLQGAMLLSHALRYSLAWLGDAYPLDADRG